MLRPLHACALSLCLTASPAVFAESLTAYGRDRVLVTAAEDFYADPQAFCDEITTKVGLPRHDLGTPEPFNSEPSADMDPEVRAQLRASLEQDIEAVEAMLGRPMPWGG